jgi:hypothetical protein
LSGIGSPTEGRLAFRYFVENGGPSGTNSNYIGIDSVSYVPVGSFAEPISLLPPVGRTGPDSTADAYGPMGQRRPVGAGMAGQSPPRTPSSVRSNGSVTDWDGTAGFAPDPDSATDTPSRRRWQAVSNASGREVLHWLQPIDLTDATRATLTFASSLTRGRSAGEVQVSSDGITWLTVGGVTEGREEVAVDLSTFAGRVVYVRFVFSTSGPMDAPPDVWTIDGVAVQIR